MKDSRFARLLIIAFWPLTALVLFCDSRAFNQAAPFGQWISDALCVIFLLLLITQMKPQRRLVALLFVPLSTVGELVFTRVLGLYHYRLAALPIYVPFGHAVLLSVGLALADNTRIARHEARLKKFFFPLHAVVAGCVLLLFGDTLSVLFAVVFYGALRAQCGRPFYFILGILVCYVELIGTHLGCWVWEPNPYALLRTTNPPASAYGCYAIADYTALRCAVHASFYWHRFTGRSRDVAACES